MRMSASTSAFGAARRGVPPLGFAQGIAEPARHVRQAVSLLYGELRRMDAGIAFRHLFGAENAKGEIADGEDLAQRAGWALVGTWIVAVYSGELPSNSTFVDAERWFTGNAADCSKSLADQLDSSVASDAWGHLHALRLSSEVSQMLPYILDAHGPGSRASIMRDPGTRKARDSKRESGVFYTPADVAIFMAGAVLEEHGGIAAELRCLDPACGTGVFLRALLACTEKMTPNLDRFNYASRCLFGLDVSALAVEAACFILLHDCLPFARLAGLQPRDAWHRLRQNFSIVDSLTVHVDPPADNGLWASKGEWGCSLSRIFPSVERGFDLLLGNPPYAAIGMRSDRRELEENYACASRGASTQSDRYPFFIELMWKLTRTDLSAAALVVPLSIAYQTRPQFVALRKAIRKVAGRWRFAFFDREPHALFGEDVKTRNAIVFHRRLEPSQPEPIIETGPLRKWTSRTRDALFRSIAYTALETTEIDEGIPKIDGALQSHALAVLAARRDRLSDFWLAATPVDPLAAFEEQHAPTVYIASTAYNFLNVFRPHVQPRESRGLFTENPVLAIRCADEVKAQAIFAILSSRLIDLLVVAHSR